MSLPKEHTTASYESLPEGLKAIAEKIIKKKYGLVKERDGYKAIQFPNWDHSGALEYLHKETRKAVWSLCLQGMRSGDQVTAHIDQDTVRVSFDFIEGGSIPSILEDEYVHRCEKAGALVPIYFTCR